MSKEEYQGQSGPGSHEQVNLGGIEEEEYTQETDVELAGTKKSGKQKVVFAVALLLFVGAGVFVFGRVFFGTGQASSRARSTASDYGQMEPLPPQYNQPLGQSSQLQIPQYAQQQRNPSSLPQPSDQYPRQPSVQSVQEYAPTQTGRAPQRPAIQPIVENQSLQNAPEINFKDTTAANEELVADLMAQLKAMNKSIKETCATNGSSVNVAELETYKAQIQQYQEEREFLLKNSKENAAKYSYLRKVERKQRHANKDLAKKIEQLQAEIAGMREHASKTRATQQRASNAVQPVAKPSGNPLPRGWRISGMCATIVAFDNPNKHESRTLQVGDSLEGVKIIAINTEERAVTTSHGTAYFKRQ